MKQSVLFFILAGIVPAPGSAEGLDEAQIQKILENAQRNPAQFYETWSPEQKAALKKMSQAMESAGQVQ